MSELDCYYDAQGCLVCPEVPAVVGSPAYYSNQAVVGWNAGANSITELDGDMHTVFTQPSGVTGVVIGFRSGRTRNTVPNLVEHGFYFQSVGEFDAYQVIEAGVVRVALAQRAADDEFEIRRVANEVSYYVNGTLVYASSVPSYGKKVVNACLYTSGDVVAGGTGAPVPSHGMGTATPDRTGSGSFQFAFTDATGNPVSPAAPVIVGMWKYVPNEVFNCTWLAYLLQMDGYTADAIYKPDSFFTGDANYDHTAGTPGQLNGFSVAIDPGTYQIDVPTLSANFGDYNGAAVYGFVIADGADRYYIPGTMDFCA